MSVKNFDIVKESIPNRLYNLIKTNNYFFHITNQENCLKIIEEGYIHPLTIEQVRKYELQRKGLPLTGTSSFTTDPILIYEEDLGDCFLDKNVVLVLDKQSLLSRGVFKPTYVPQEVLLMRYLQNYHYGLEECEDENEWRSLGSVFILDILHSIHIVPQRRHNVSTNTLEFEGLIKRQV